MACDCYSCKIRRSEDSRFLNSFALIDDYSVRSALVRNSYTSNQTIKKILQWETDLQILYLISIRNNLPEDLYLMAKSRLDLYNILSSNGL